MQPIAEQVIGEVFDPPTPQIPRSASAFLMNSDLSTGGTERQYSLLAKALRRGPFEIHLGCMRRRGAFLKGIEPIDEFDVAGSFLTNHAQRARRALAKHLRKGDVAIAHAFDFYANLMLVPVARWARVPVVIGSQRQLGDLLSPMQQFAQWAVFQLCTRVVCNSRAAASRLVNGGLRETKIVVIPNGLPDEAFSEFAPVLRHNSIVVRVGLVARMNHPGKNQSLFLQAAAYIAKRFPNVEFVLVGDGPYREPLERLAEKLGITHRVQFLGERTDIPAVLAGLDISVVTSNSESLSNVILESMASGKPVIATRVGGNTELVREGETGLLVPPQDVHALTHAIEILLTMPDLGQEMGQAARRVARADFCLKRICEQYEQLYASLLKEKSWKPKSNVAVPTKAKSCKPLRVAIVAPPLHYVGGQAVQADLLIRNWKGDPELEATFEPIDPKLPRGLLWVERIRYLRTVVRMPFFIVSLWRLMSRVEMVHIFSSSYSSFLLRPVPAWLMARVRGKKASINYRSGEAPDHLRRSCAARGVLRRVDQIVVPSQYLVDVFQQYDLQAKVVPNLVDLTQFTYRDRIPVRPSLICTRMFEPYYQVDIVVRALAEVAKTFPEVSLCLVGSGSQERQLRTVAAELNLSNIEFAGAVSRDRIGHYYDRADIFVNASRLDNMPVSILEAFASGTPVVTTAPDGIRYLVEHDRTGLLYNTGDWCALART